MTLPGKMLTESVDRLARTISASKAVSDELKGASTPAPRSPIPTEEVSEGGRDSGGAQGS